MLLQSRLTDNFPSTSNDRYQLSMITSDVFALQGTSTRNKVDRPPRA